MNFENSGEKIEMSVEEAARYFQDVENEVLARAETEKNEGIKERMIRRIKIWAALAMIAIGLGKN